MAPQPVFEVSDLTVLRDNSSPLFSNLSLTLAPGEVLVVRGVSGSGKTTLLKCIAELNLYSKGKLKLHGKESTKWGIPEWRIKVAYIPQRPSLLPGTPLDFLETIRSFSVRLKQKQKAQSDKDGDGNGNGNGQEEGTIDPLDLAQEWGIEKYLWKRDWGTLSGGEGQRIALAIAVGIGGAEVLLLDEPTSAIDDETAQKIEKSLLGMLPSIQGGSHPVNGVRRKGTGPRGLIWITHSAEQADRVGTRTLDLSNL
ncbi:uncharacterized protein IL334_000671 [Kwoniella shivajii]|uniref:ABC transporter domain-containing protein n=1 Tax=Kwoniella shivajii TaxID=564305 RepID=A0ABZ1CQ98_9TREE|nr:hypothetical protein IL334_000671 [Kwoniella shivajii]